jgi:hypothetical protein
VNVADLANRRIGYVPLDATLSRPGDRRRFVHHARARGLKFEIADPAKDYDVVILTEQADLSVWSRYDRAPLVYDLIDSYLAIPRSNIKGQLRGVAKFLSRQSRFLQLDHRRAVETTCRRASAVVCTTEEQAADIAPLCRNVHVILDAQDDAAQEPKTDYAAHAPFRLAWEGLGVNVRSLGLLQDVLRDIDREREICLTLVTDPRHRRYLGRFIDVDTLALAQRIFPRVILHPWDEATSARHLSECDLGLIPLDADDPFERGKPENKLLLLWRLGLPVITTATPAYSRAMRAAGLDMACRTSADWRRTILHHVNDGAARQDAGERGRRFALAHHGGEALLARWDQVFASIS